MQFSFLMNTYNKVLESYKLHKIQRCTLLSTYTHFQTSDRQCAGLFRSFSHYNEEKKYNVVTVLHVISLGSASVKHLYSDLDIVPSHHIEL